MKKVVLFLLVAIGFYTLFRNNVFRLPDQIIWSISHDPFYKLFVPALMFFCAAIALIVKKNSYLFLIALSASAIDLVNRVAVWISHIVLDLSPAPLDVSHTNSAIVVNRMWISHIMLLLELVILFLSLKYVVKIKPVFKKGGS